MGCLQSDAKQEVQIVSEKQDKVEPFKEKNKVTMQEMGSKSEP